MSQPVQSFLNGASSAAGAYAMNKYVIPVAEKAAIETAKKTNEVAHNHGNAIGSALVNGAIGGALFGIPGAVVGATGGWVTGKEQDVRAAQKLEETGEDERCLIQ